MRKLLQVPNAVYRYLFALLWAVNGLWCKVLGMVPRHEQIVGSIASAATAGPLTVLIGAAEIGMAVWIVAGWRYRLCATVQVAVIMLMNIIEYVAVPHLLLWGRGNLFFAVCLCSLILWNAWSPRRTADG